MAQFTPPVPLVNGHRYSFASIEATFGNRKIQGIKAVTYKPSLEPGLVYGTTSLPLGRTRGKASFSVSFEMYKSEFTDLITGLSNTGSSTVGNGQSPIGFLEVAFDLIIAYSESPSSPVITDKCIAIRITSADDSHSEGNEPIAVKCDCSCMNIFMNGIPAVTGVPTIGV